MLTRRAASALAIVVVLVASGLASIVGASPAAADSTITFAGGGFGHGVGMSQYGAYGMASIDGASPATILTHYYSGTSVQPVGQAGGLRVRIANGIGGSTFTGAGTVNFVLNGQIIAAAAPGQPFSIAAESGGIRLSNPGGPFVPPGNTLQVQYAPAPVRVSGTQCGGGGCRYSRGLIVARNTGSSLTLTVEVLSMQDYLYGIGEVPSSWPAAALQAQAIAARTYANYFTYTRRANGQAPVYDLDASTADQFYIGYEKEAEAGFGQFWVSAVNATADQNVLYNGAPIQAFYFSSSGGYTENSENVFVAALPYLRGVPDPRDQNSANPNYRWTRTYTIGQLSSWLSRAADTNVGTVAAIGINPGPSVSGRIDKGTVTITGSGATKQVSGSRFRTVVNSGVSQDGGGLSQQFLSTMISTDPTHDLHGSLDWVQRVPGGLQVAGWAADDDTSAPIDVHVYVDNNGYVIGPAALNRPDVGAAFPALGPNHGFIATVPAGGPGTHRVCAWAINTLNGAGFNKPVGCQTVTVSIDPFGSFDSGARSGPGVHVAGWTIDPDTAAPIALHVYVDGTFAGATSAAASRPDVGAAYPAYGPNHGFDTAVGNFGPGPHVACVYGINDVQPGNNTQLGCRSVTGSPFGSLDLAVRSGSGVRVAGWSIDPDTAAPTAVHVYVDGTFAGATSASVPRADVGSAYPAYGPNHAFDAIVGNVGPGTHTVCVYGINDTTVDSNSTLGCATFS